MNAKFKRNRCTLLYIDSGAYRFHTVHQKPGNSIVFKPADLYFAKLIQRTTWPPFFPARQKNSEGEKIEYGIALFYFITPAEALKLLQKMNQKEIVQNK